MVKNIYIQYISLFPPHRADETPWPRSSLNLEMDYSNEKEINSSSCSDMLQAGILKRLELQVREAPWELVQPSNCGGGIFVKAVFRSVVVTPPCE